MSVAWAQAHSNIALIKYWGKRDECLKLPHNSSISLTLDALWTRTRVEWLPSHQPDRLYLNGQVAPENQRRKVQTFIDRLRQRYGCSGAVEVRSENNFPTGAGLASSASGFAALALAASAAAGLKLSACELSRLAREGSGSACRSIYGGFVEWQRGQLADGSDSVAVPLEETPDWPLVMAVLILNEHPKPLSSSEGMARTVKTSPLYAGWLDSIAQDLSQMRQAIAQRDFHTLGALMEHNALKMHATALAARPAVLYWQAETLTLIQRVQQLRAEGLACYFTIDAGPNLKVLMPASDWPAFAEACSTYPEILRILPCRPGPGAHLLEGLA